MSAAKKTDALLNRLFIEPLLGMGYPVRDLKILQRLERFYKDGDSAKLAFNMDFVGPSELYAGTCKTCSIYAIYKSKDYQSRKKKGRRYTDGIGKYIPLRFIMRSCDGANTKI